MAKTIDNGGPAFPKDRIIGGNEGMSLRDYFAGQALANIADAYNGQAFDPIRCASIAYEYADAMLAAREAS